MTYLVALLIVGFVLGYGIKAAWHHIDSDACWLSYAIRFRAHCIHFGLPGRCDRRGLDVGSGTWRALGLLPRRVGL